MKKFGKFICDIAATAVACAGVSIFCAAVPALVIWLVLTQALAMHLSYGQTYWGFYLLFFTFHFLTYEAE